MAKRMGTYRVDEDVLGTALAFATERGETVTDVLTEALHAYIRRCRGAGIADAPPVSEPSVYTHPESPERYDEPPSGPACKHPVASVDELGMCHECDTEVW